jgi:CIC family chloride channel protein
VLARKVASSPVFSIPADRPLAEVRSWLGSGAPGSDHQGFPVVGEAGELLGVLTHRDLLDPRHPRGVTVADIMWRPPVFVYDDATLRQVADRMTEERIGRIPVVTRSHPMRPVGMISRSDLLSAHQKRIHSATRAERTFGLGALASVAPKLADEPAAK